MSAQTLSEITQRLLAATGASRTTVRLEGDGSFPIVAEAVAPGIPSLSGTTVPNMTAAGTFLHLARERTILVQPDLDNADPAPPPALIAAYGARAQMLAPILDGERLIGILSVHESTGPRDWSEGDVQALEAAAASVTRAVEEDGRIDLSEHADVVVIGAGTSGATLASRLSDDSARTVVLIEAGQDLPNEAADPPSFVTGGTLIGGYFAGNGAPTPEMDWGYYSQPFPSGRRVHLWRGRLVGGTSMINGCIAVRGKPSDFDDWEALGAHGWSWRDVEPFFEAVEREVPIRPYPRERWQPFQTAFVDGLVELGFREAENINAPDSWDGVTGAWPQNRRNEIRQGSLITYVRRARGRENFRIVDRALVDRVTIEDGRAIGVRYIRNGEATELRADTVVVSSGSYGSPAILLRSGIGPADELRALGIDVVADLPVGRGLRDHPQTLFRFVVPPALAEMYGPGLAVVGRGDGWWSFPLSMDEEGLCGIAVALTTQDPLGSVTLASANPDEAPLIEHNLQLAIDRGDFTSAWNDIRDLCATDTFRELGVQGGDLEQPLDDTLVERLATAYHPACSCAIGSVVDERLRVLGVEGLRVADASIFPSHVTNNPNLTCFMVGERAAALIDEDTAARRGAEASASAR